MNMAKKNLAFGYKLCGAFMLSAALTAFPELAMAATSQYNKINALETPTSTVKNIAFGYVMPTIATLSLVAAVINIFGKFNPWALGGFVGTAVVTSSGETFLNFAKGMTF